MKLGLCSISRRDDPLAEVCREAAEVGFDGIELWGQPPHLPALTREAGAEAAAVVRDAGLEPAVMGSYLRPGAASFGSELDGVLAAAEGYGAPLLRVWAGDKSDSKATEDDWQRALADFRTLLDRCGDRVITIERHAQTLSESAAGTERLLAELTDPRLTLNYQHAHGATTETDVAEIRRFGERISNVHAQNTRDGVPWSLEQGELDYHPICGALRAIGYNGYIEVEFVRGEGRRELSPDEHREALTRDFAYLRSCLEAATE